VEDPATGPSTFHKVPLFSSFFKHHFFFSRPLNLFAFKKPLYKTYIYETKGGGKKKLQKKLFKFMTIFEVSKNYKA
jgi:hypothetical protein